MAKCSPNISSDENYSDPRLSEESSKSGLLYEQSILLSHRGEEQWILPEEESLERLVLFDGIEAEYGNLDEQENGEAEAEYGNLERDGMGESGYIRRSWISRQLEESGELQEGKNYWHRDSRRSFSHDYCSPGYYMITASITDGSPALSMIPDIDLPELKRGEMIMPLPAELGKLIQKEIMDIPRHHREIRIMRFVLMPDHIHVVMGVKERLKRKLGNELAGFLGACSKHRMAICGDSELKTLFKPFNDRIIYNFQQLDRAIKYVVDNPRRLIIKRKLPDLFKRYLHLDIAGHEYAAYGNIFLLKGISLLPVRIHRRWSEQEFADYKNRCRVLISQGAIPISPAIHKAEKEIINSAVESGSSVILLKDQGFEERFKPKGKEFDLCSEGRLLLLAPWPENIGRKSTSGYTEFHKMNDLALAISSLPANSRLSLKPSSR